MQRENTALLQSFYELLDIAVVSVLVVGLFTIANLGSMPHGIDAFLLARLTIPHALMGLGFLLIWHMLFRTLGVYRTTPPRSFAKEARQLFAASSLASAFILVFPAMSRTHAFAWPVAIYFWVAATAICISTRAIRRVLTNYIVADRENVIIVGSGPKALSLYREIDSKVNSQYQVLGFVDSPNGHRVPEEIQSRMLGRIEHLERILMNRVVDHVMIALPIKSCYDDIQRTIAVCEQAGVESDYLSDPFNLSVAHAEYGTLHTRPIVRFEVVRNDHRLMIKRAIDILGTCFGLVVLAPAMLLIAVTIKLTSRGPVLFTPERYGLNKRRFRMLKFRTMVVDAEAQQMALESRNEASGPVFKIRDDPRVTTIGRFLRKSSLDELPQFFNVLLGQMSLVGPRPLPVRDVSKFTDASLMRRFSVKPGLTCLWQINGRSNTDFDHWIALDLEYIDRWSIWLDLRILLATVPAVVVGRGAA